MLAPNRDLNITESQAAAMARPGSYDLSAGLPTGIAGWNQYMMQAAEFFDPFIQESLLKRPRHWYNAIPRGAKSNFSGLTGETRVFRGGIGHQAGLDMFRVIDPVPSDTNNPCAPRSFTTNTVAWESLDWKGYDAYWGSDPICGNQWKYTPEAIKQLGWILKDGAERGIDIQEVWNRDWLIRTAAIDADGGAGRGYVMTKTFAGNESPEKFFYDPLVQFGTGAGQVNPATGITKPFIVFKAGSDVETLNFDMLEALRDELEVSCPDSAIGSDGGEPLFGLPISKRDFKKYILGNEFQVKNWRESPSYCEQLITGIKNVKTFEGWALPGDGNQLRFKVRKVVTTYDSDTYGGVGSALDGEDVIIAEFVAPRIPGRTGENGIAIPKFNPEYNTAELAVAPLQMNKMFVNEFGTALTGLGSGTVFGPSAGMNGRWEWVNNRDNSTNIFGEKGMFVGKFEIFPHPEPNVVFATAILYRRCTESIKSRCPVDNAEINLDTATGVSAEGVAYSASTPDAAADAFSLTATLDKSLKDTAVTRNVTVEFTGSGDPVVIPAVVIKTSTAPTYQFHVMGSGVIDLVTLANAADGKYHITVGGKLAKTVDAAVVELVLGTVTAG